MVYYQDIYSHIDVRVSNDITNSGTYDYKRKQGDILLLKSGFPWHTFSLALSLDIFCQQSHMSNKHVA
jgi:hypothetical protein